MTANAHRGQHEIEQTQAASAPEHLEFADLHVAGSVAAGDAQPHQPGGDGRKDHQVRSGGVGQSDLTVVDRQLLDVATTGRAVDIAPVSRASWLAASKYAPMQNGGESMPCGMSR